LTGSGGVDLRRLMQPASIAVVGASDRPESYGGQTVRNLDTIGYPGEVWGVNPKRSEVLGRPCVPTVADLPTAVDAVVIAIPAAGVPSVVEQAGARGCGSVVVFSAGFAEVEGGAQRQSELIAAARRHSLPVCGPNCNGIVALHRRVALWGDAFAPREPGAVALISQSGNVAVNALATRRGLRFHTVIASGNQAVLSAADYIEFLASEDGVGAIALYLEDDGGPSLCDGLAACAERGIRAVVLKVGSSSAGARAATAHSAALAGDQRIFRSLVQEAGAVWAEDVHELLELAKTLAVPLRSPSRPGLAIMTCSGGDSAQGADEADHLGLTLPRLAPSTRDRLAELLPSVATAANPLDYTAVMWGDTAGLAELVRTLGEDPAIGQVLVFYDQLPGVDGPSEASWRAVREGIMAGAATSPVATMVASTLPELLDDDAAWLFARGGVPAVAGLRTGLRCAAATQLALGDPVRLREIAATARAAAAARAGDGAWLPEHESKELLRTAGVPVVEGRVVTSENDAAKALGELGPPVVLKVSAASVQHKSELGGLALGLRSEDEVRLAYRRLSALAEASAGAVLAERMAARGVELLVAVRTDAIVPAVVVGLGGIWAELLDDVVIVPLPARATRIEQALHGMRGAPLLNGGRGAHTVDVSAVARLAERTAELLIDAGIAEIELNPVLASAAGAVVLDALVRPMTAAPVVTR
jgi:acyl-CoA synthetase (NDP forming)